MSTGARRARWVRSVDGISSDEKWCEFHRKKCSIDSVTTMEVYAKFVIGAQICYSFETLSKSGDKPRMLMHAKRSWAQSRRELRAGESKDEPTKFSDYSGILRWEVCSAHITWQNKKETERRNRIRSRNSNAFWAQQWEKNSSLCFSSSNFSSWSQPVFGKTARMCPRQLQ